MKFDHFHIRLITPADTNAYFELVENNRPRLEDFFAGTVARTKTPEAAHEFLQELHLRSQQKTFFPYALVDEKTNRFAGYLHVMSFDWNIPKAEIGFFMDQAYESKGIMTRAVQQLMHHYFNDLRFNKLFLRTHPTNKGCRALAERCGFEQEGIIRKDYKTSRGELVDLIYYGKLCPE